MTLLHAGLRHGLSTTTGMTGSDCEAAPHASLRGLVSALAALHSGGAVALVDDLGPYPDCSVLIAARYATTELVSFLVRHTSGFIEVSLPRRHADRLDLGPMVHGDGPSGSPSYGIAVDAAEGTGTGISAADRARTMTLLGDPDTAQDDLNRPGHVMTYRAHDTGMVGKADAGEAAYDLVRLAGAGVAAARATLVSDQHPIHTARIREATEWSLRHRLPLVMASTILEFRLNSNDPVEKV